MKKIFLITMAAVICIFNMIGQNPINHTYPLNDGPDINPMKGWNAGWWDDFDEASVGFQYLGWKDFEPTDGNFDFTAVENVINRPGSDGKHLILRLFTDWFGNDPISAAGPDWLYSTYNVARLQSPNGKYITDYNNPNYITQASEAISALAAHYENDPRIYSFELGILGYWGEWHTFSYDDPNFEIEANTSTQILDSYHNNFSNVKLMGRYPWREPLASDGTIGYHNDYFLPNNGHSDEFDDAVFMGSKWLNGPIGGEIPPVEPNDREQFMTDLYETTTGLNMIERGHYSTMKVPNNLRPCDIDPNSARCQGFMAMHRKMGYNFQIQSTLFPEIIQQSENLSIDLDISNIGMAPMYYDWHVQFALLDINDVPIKIFETPYNLTTILANQSTYTITGSTSLIDVPIGDYQLVVRLIQPDADTDKQNPWELNARNTYILFSNDIPTIGGVWNANNALEGGWSILGDVSVEESIVAARNVLIYHETNGFRHGSINNGISLITNLGNTNGLWTTTETQDSSNFNAATLANYDLVIWCNTSGNGLLTIAEQQAFETWMTNGGAYMGIHAATDTYRDGSWPFYNELVGAIVQTGPNHTANNHNDNMDILEKHPSVDHLGATWNKTEEYYYWELNGGQLSTDNNNVLYVESTGGNSYDAPRPMAWYKTSVTVNGITTPVRAFYTALGHNGSDYNNDPDFQQHIEGAIIWALPPEVTTYVSPDWDNGSPTPNMLAIVDALYNTGTDGNIEARDLIVNSGVTLTIDPNSAIEIRENITVNGFLTVKHEGNVVQTSPVGTTTNNGSIKVEVTTPVLQTRDFMVMGSPMDTETRNGVFVNAFLVLDHAPNNFNPNTHPNIPQGATNFSDLEGDLWTTYTGAINPGEGYIVRPQTGYGDPAGITYDMTYSAGTLNNGLVSRPMIYNNTNSPAGTPNAYANPYPSAIDADQFIQDNGLNALYFWEHLTPPSVIIPGEGLKFDMDDISIRNDGGGVAANNDNPLNIPNNVISTGQGFAIKATTNGTVNFTNDMRLNTGNTTLRSSEEEVDRLWLHIESDAYQLANNILIGFNPQATAGIDPRYDTDRLACSVSIYSQLETGDERFSIQTREAFNDAIKIPVGFSTLLKEETSFTISLSNFEGSNLVDRAIYLYDNKLNILTDLTAEDYSFRSGMASEDRRFTVVFEYDEEVLGANEASLENIAVYPNPTDGTINIISTRAPLEAIKVYDVLGRAVAKENLDAVQGYQLDLSRLKAAVYFVEIVTPQGTVIKRIVKK